jgi:uncharacterized protein YkwD
MQETMQRIRMLLAALVVTGLAAPAAAHACPSEGASPSELSVGEARTAIVCLINERRQAAGAPKLGEDARLDRAAQRHSRAMDSANFFGHTGPDGNPITRARAAGYFAGASSWALGENLRWGTGGQGSPRTAVTRWMNSASHRSAMLSGTYRDVGIGVVKGSPRGGGGDNTAIYTVKFGFRR